MTLTTNEISVDLFIRGLTNLKAQLTKAQAHATSAGMRESDVLDATLGASEGPPNPADLHMYSLANHVHWAAEGARVAMALLVGASRAPTVNAAKSFSQLHEHLDATIAALRAIAPGDLESSLDREIVIERRDGSMRSNGRRFLVAFAIPHFFYHITTAYGILRNQGVPLRMGDFLGNWME